MFEQIDSTFQKGMSEHTCSVQQHLESGHTSLAMTLRVIHLIILCYAQMLSFIEIEIIIMRLDSCTVYHKNDLDLIIGILLSIEFISIGYNE